MNLRRVKRPSLFKFSLNDPSASTKELMLLMAERSCGPYMPLPEASVWDGLDVQEPGCVTQHCGDCSLRTQKVETIKNTLSHSGTSVKPESKLYE